MQPNMNVNRPMPQGDMGGNYQQMPQPEGRSHKMLWTILVIVVVVILAGLAYMFRDKFKSSSADKLSGYQAVFLTNGQVYFGKLAGVNSEYATLSDIYYLQVNQALQTGANGQPAAQSQQQQQQLSLVKLGNELHGPVDLMHIAKDQILFYEDLKSDGKVAQAIASYKSGNNGQPAAQSQQPAQQQAPAQQTPAPAGK